MTKLNKIQIVSENSQIDIYTERDITEDLLSRMEKQMNAIVNDNVYHDIYGRLTSINMTLYMLERMTPPDTKKQVQLLKSQIADLTLMIETMTG